MESVLHILFGPFEWAKEFAEKIFEFFEDAHEQGLHHLFTAPALVVLGLLFTHIVDATLLPKTPFWTLVFFPVWGPFFSYKIYMKVWIMYVQLMDTHHTPRSTLEIKLPALIEKTPSAMEYVFAGIHVHSPGAMFYANWWRGLTHPDWSFELHSYEGELHFFVNCETSLIDLFKAQMYAQYPGVEVVEVRDQFSGLHFNPDTMIGYGLELVKKPNGLPIKTYVEFGQDDVFIDTEERTDPLCELFESLSGLGPGEQAFVQIIVSKDMEGHWKHEAKHHIEKIYEKSAIGYVDVVTGQEKKSSSQLTPVDVKQVKALERTLEKNVFETGVRVFYLTKKKDHKPRMRSTRFVHMFRQFHSDIFNSLKSGREYWHQPLDYPWQDYKDFRRKRFSRDIIEALKLRELFKFPYEHMKTAMTAEELATIYHLPSNECKAPGIVRMQSKRGHAPENLPV